VVGAAHYMGSCGFFDDSIRCVSVFGGARTRYAVLRTHVGSVATPLSTGSEPFGEMILCATAAPLPLRSRCANVLPVTRALVDNGKAFERPGDAGRCRSDGKLALGARASTFVEGPVITQCPTHGGGGGRAPGGGGGGGGGERKGGRSSRAHDDGGDSYYPPGGGAGGSGGGGKPPPKGAGPSLDTDGGHRASCHRCVHARPRSRAGILSLTRKTFGDNPFRQRRTQ